MAKRRKGKSGKRRATKRTTSPTVTVRFANPRRSTMAKRRRRTRKNPANPANPSRRRRRHHSPKRRYARRRNPTTFAERAGKLAAGAVVAIATGVGVTYAASKIMPGQAVSMYGIPALAFLAGVGIARTMPTLGVGMALGSFSPFVVPVTSKLLTATTPATPTTPATTAAVQAAGMARAYRQMQAVQMGRGMRAVQMGAIDRSVYAR